MKEIGSYFEIELPKGNEYHENALKLNSGRNALWYIIKAYYVKRIYLPFYICDSVLEPIKDIKIDYEFYSIDENFEPILNVELKRNEFILYVNYFGIKDDSIDDLSNKIENLIIDNSQAFYSPIRKPPTFYSPRKFFGVPDGAYLYTDEYLKLEMDQDVSFEKCLYLLKRLDLSSNEGYEDYRKVEEEFSHDPIKKMSKLTQRILSSINYKKVKNIREQNFQYLHKKLKDLNELKITLKNLNGPLKYPFLIDNENLKNYLIQNKIYVSTYWQEVLPRVEKNTIEYYLTKYLVPLPIDQRYNKKDMNFIIEKINEALSL